MKLTTVNCKVCLKEVFAEAEICRHCGTKEPGIPVKWPLAPLVIAWAVLGIMTALILFATDETPGVGLLIGIGFVIFLSCMIWGWARQPSLLNVFGLVLFAVFLSVGGFYILSEAENWLMVFAPLVLLIFAVISASQAWRIIMKARRALQVHERKRSVN